MRRAAIGRRAGKWSEAVRAEGEAIRRSSLAPPDLPCERPSLAEPHVWFDVANVTSLRRHLPSVPQRGLLFVQEHG
eukprot:5645237-Alexandrium_andersonii.AAC.1